MEIPITCHQDAHRHFSVPEGDHWRQPDAAVRKDGSEGRSYRSCSYCGCIHPEDLLAALKVGATLGSSDWKYGWPHKFYISDIPNPNQGAMVRKVSGGGYKTELAAQAAGAKYMKDGHRLEVMVEKHPDHATETFKETGYFRFEIYEPASATTHAKFYSTHLKDFPDLLFDELVKIVFDTTGVQFARDEKGLKYATPNGVKK